MRSRLWRAVLDNSLLLLAGSAAALVWANIDPAGYERIARPLHFWVNDVGMVFFFALAAKEVFEATLPGGALSSIRRAVVPLAAAGGGMAVPALIYAGLVWAFGPANLMRGWAIPCATDIAFSAMVARVIFPAGHPAVPFLLLLAIADDAAGLFLLAAFYPSSAIAPLPFALLVAAALASAAWLRRRTNSFWPFLFGPGLLSWAGLYLGGVHPALALVPVIPFMPHSARYIGLFEPREARQADTLNRFEHWWAVPVQFILLLFGFANAGVPFAEIGAGTSYVLAALLIGKPAGILLFCLIAGWLGARRPPELNVAALMVLGIAASIGFTVSMFFATAAFAEGPALAQTKMGALLSFAAAPLAIVMSRLVRLRR